MEAAWGPNSNRQDHLTWLVQTYQTPLLHIAYMILHDAALAEDAVQETFIKAYQALPGYRGESSEKTWLMRIAINTCRDMRRSRWFRFVDRRVTPDLIPNAFAAMPINEEHESLAQAILHLSDEHKEIILLYYYQNFTVTELAQILSIAPSSVSHRLKKAREKLRTLMERGN